MTNSHDHRLVYSCAELPLCSTGGGLPLSLSPFASSSLDSSCSSFVGPSSRLPIVARVTPLNLREFQKELSQHPDRAHVAYVVDGIRDGFRTGFVSESVSARRNMLSASEHPSVIDS